MGNRGASYLDFEEASNNNKLLRFTCPTRGTMGIRSEMLNISKGKA